MRGRRKSVWEGRVLLVVPDSEELARVATGLRSAGWRVSALSRFEAAPPVYSSTAPVIQRLATLSRGTLPIWVACACPAAYSGDETPNRAPVVGVLPTPAILLGATQSEGLAEVRSRLLARFDAAKFQLEGDWISPSVSLGGCCFPDVLGPPEALLKAACRDPRATASRAGDSLTMAVAGDR